MDLYEQDTILMEISLENTPILRLRFVPNIRLRKPLDSKKS